MLRVDCSLWLSTEYIRKSSCFRAVGVFHYPEATRGKCSSCYITYITISGFCQGVKSIVFPSLT
jgi:hypothetical protein